MYASSVGISRRMCLTCTKIRFSSGSTRDGVFPARRMQPSVEHETCLHGSKQARTSFNTAVCAHAHREDKEDYLRVDGWLDSHVVDDPFQ